VLNGASVRRAASVLGGLLAVFAVSELLGVLTIEDHQGIFPIPLGVMLLSAILGCLTALVAVGIVLIYRASRIINFAQAGFGAAAAVLFFELIQYKHWPYPIALILALLGGTAAGFLCELLFIRRFANSPRLVLTVVTLALGQVLVAVAGFVPGWLGDKFPQSGIPRTAPGSWTYRVFPIVLTGNHVMLVVVTVAIMAAIAVFFRFTSVGTAVRGSAENNEQASLLGINTGAVSSLVWMIAAALASVGAIMQTSISGPPNLGAGVAIGSITLLLRALTAAVIGRMENLPVTVAAAIGISVFERSVSFSFSNTAIVDVVALGTIIGMLLLKRKRFSRAADSGAGTWAATEEIRPVPPELAGLSSVKMWTRRVKVVGAGVLLLYPWVMSPGQTDLGSLFCIYAIIVLSLVVLTGWGGQISLGQFAFVAVGAVVGGSLTSKAHLPFLVALVAASLVGAAFAVLIGLPALRIRGPFLAVTTLAFAVVVDSVGLNPRYLGAILPRTVNRPALFWIQTEDGRAFYYFCLACVVVTVLAVLGIRKSRTGRVLIAMRDNERTAQTYGINLVRTRLATFALSGFLAAFAGGLYAAHQHGVAREAFGPDQSISMFVIAVIGGLGSPIGALSGAVYFGLLRLFVGSASGQLLGTSVVLLVLLMFFPGGLGAGLYKLRDSVLRRTAIRRRIYVPSLLGQYGFTGGQVAKVPLAPRFGADGKAQTSSKWEYRQPSRIGKAGGSQTLKRWSY
jgi:branched-chain amino acid transport system permease protein